MLLRAGCTTVGASPLVFGSINCFVGLGSVISAGQANLAVGVYFVTLCQICALQLLSKSTTGNKAGNSLTVNLSGEGTAGNDQCFCVLCAPGITIDRAAGNLNGCLKCINS